MGLAAVIVVLVLSITLVAITTSEDSSGGGGGGGNGKRAPLGIAVSGGGFRTMTQAMGVARAVGTAWPAVTHVGGASGGAWFANQFAYSKGFYEAVLGGEPLEDVLIDWGARFGAAHAGAVAAGAAWTSNNTDAALAANPVCAGFLAEHEAFQQQYSTNVGFAGVWNWFHYAHAMFGGWIDDAETARVGRDNMTGLATATVVTMLSVPADAYLNGSRRLAVRDAPYVGDGEAPANLSALLVPAALAAPPGGRPAAWIVNDQLGPLTARVGSGAAAAILPDTPTVLEVLAATGAASASLASRTWLREDLANGAAPLPWLPAALADYALLDYLADHCLPLALETHAGPLLADGADLSAAALGSADEADFRAFQDATTYRLADGGFNENTGAPSILARMQRDCDDGALDCSGAHKLLIVDSSGFYTTPLFFGGGYPAGDVFEAWDTRIPSIQIFAEPPPADEAAWPAYAESEYPTTELLGPATGLAFDGNTTTVRATYWTGRATTVENAWFGVKGGDAVDVLILRGNTAVLDVPQGTDRGVPSTVPAAWQAAWSDLYGPLARDQSDGARGVIAAWLGGGLAPGAAAFPAPPPALDTKAFYISMPELYEEASDGLDLSTAFAFFGTWQLEDPTQIDAYLAAQGAINDYVVATHPGTWVFTAAYDNATGLVYNLEMYASEAVFVTKMFDATFQALAGDLAPLFGANVPEVYVVGDPGPQSRGIIDASSTATYMTSAAGSWLAKECCRNGTFALALPFAYNPASQDGLRASGAAMMNYTNAEFGYPSYVLADDGAGTGLWLELVSSEEDFLHHQPDPTYEDLYRAVATDGGIIGMQAFVLGAVGDDVVALMATLDTAPVTVYLPTVPGGLAYERPTEATPAAVSAAMSAVYEFTFAAFEPYASGTLTVYGGVEGAPNKCWMAPQMTIDVTLSPDDIFSSTGIIEIDESPLFPGATRLIVPTMQWYRETDELGYLVVPQGVLPDWSLSPDYVGATWRDRGYRFKLVENEYC